MDVAGDRGRHQAAWLEHSELYILGIFYGEVNAVRRFSTVDLDQKLGDVKAAAARQPVVITEHRKDRFVLMTVEDFTMMKQRADPRRVYGPGGTPARLARMFGKEIERLLEDEPE